MARTAVRRDLLNRETKHKITKRRWCSVGVGVDELEIDAGLRCAPLPESI